MSVCLQSKDWESVLKQIGKMEAVSGVYIVVEGGSCGRRHFVDYRRAIWEYMNWTYVSFYTEFYGWVGGLIKGN